MSPLNRTPGGGPAFHLLPRRVKRGRLTPLRKKRKAGARSRSERSLAHTSIGRTRSSRPNGFVSLAKIFRESTGAIGAREPSRETSCAPSSSFPSSLREPERRLRDVSRDISQFATTTTGDSRISCGPEESIFVFPPPRGPRASFSAPPRTFCLS